MKIKNLDFVAAIFDLDGTLIDSTELWFNVDIEFFHKRNMDVPEDYSKKIAHIGLKDAAKFTKREYGIKESEEEIIKEWQDAAKKMYEEDIQLKEGAKEFLQLLKNNGVRIALATANDSQLYIPCLKRLGIYDCFEYIADVNDSKEGKNSVKIYSMISDKLQIEKEKTLIFEDIVTGLKTGYENGYLTVGVDDNASKNSIEEKKKYSHLYIYSFKDLM